MSKITTTVFASLAVTCFAGNSLLARAALGNHLIGSVEFTVIRLVSGSIILLPWLFCGTQERPSLLGSLSLLVYCAAFSFAYIELNAATGAMVLFAAVQVTTLFAGQFAGKRLRAVELAGAVLAMAGVSILFWTKSEQGSAFAIFFMALAGLAWGLYSILGRSAVNPARRTAGNFVVAAIIAVPLLLLNDNSQGTATGVFLAIVSGAFTSGFGYVAWYIVVPRLPHITIGAAQLATPLVAAIAGAVFLSEPLTPRFLIAAFLIVPGIYFTLKRQ